MAVRASADLFISQWQAAPNLRAVIGIWLDVLDEEIGTPLDELDAMRSLDTAMGVYLDYLGARLGVQRPYILSSADTLARFDQTGAGFDQGRFAALLALEERSPLDDTRYRAMLKARAEYDEQSGGGTLDVMTRAAQRIDSAATVVDADNMTFTITTRLTSDMQLADDVGALPRPAGVGLTIAGLTTSGVLSGGDTVLSGGDTVSN